MKKLLTLFLLVILIGSVFAGTQIANITTPKDTNDSKPELIEIGPSTIPQNLNTSSTENLDNLEIIKNNDSPVTGLFGLDQNNTKVSNCVILGINFGSFLGLCWWFWIIILIIIIIVFYHLYTKGIFDEILPTKRAF